MSKSLVYNKDADTFYSYTANNQKGKALHLQCEGVDQKASVKGDFYRLSDILTKQAKH